MHRLIFGHPFTELMALILLPGLAFYFINKKKASVHRNAKNADTGAFGSMTALTETNSGRSSLSPAETKNGASSSSLKETTSGGSSSSLMETKPSGSTSSPTKTKSGGSSSSPIETNYSATSSSLTDSKSSGSHSSPTETYNDASSSSLSPIEINSGGSSSSSTKTNNSASSSLPGKCYEVFLSSRGPDTQYGFTDHLYEGLLDAGIDAFRDNDELCHVEDIKPVLMEAIMSSKILIPIFSMDYVKSSRCLDELVQIMECKNNNEQIVLPIFYKVKPVEVRHQIGRFGEAFHKRESLLRERSSFDPTTLEKWKKAFDEVVTLKGYEAQGYEAKLVKKIVRRALSELKKKFELIVSENLVGIDTRVKVVKKFVDNNSHATLFIGIHGMGGIGKTTLAKAIYNKLSNQFEHRSFIADIRESWKHNGVLYLQKRLIKDILNRENEVSTEDEGIKFISSRFKGKKVLVLLDDVDNVGQVKCLAGNHDWFSSGSRIIITARNKGILEAAGVDRKYDLKELGYDQSLILFSKHAFRRKFPPSEFEGLTHEVVSTTGGFPLSLEVLGSLLCGKESKEWREMIKKLKKVPCIEVQEKLRISYDALDYEQKQIFLDIACFLTSTDSRISFYMWDACGFFPGENIEVLIFMSLIKIGDNHEFRMHDQLRDLGRTIVCEGNQQHPWHRSRLWDFEEVLKVLKRNKGTDKIEAIDLSKGNSEGPGNIAERDGNNYTAEQFKKLTSLRFLSMKGAHLSGDFEDSMEELKWLRWQNCPASFEVNNFDVNELVVLELQGSEINEEWEGWSIFTMAEKLKYLDISWCGFSENPDFPPELENFVSHFTSIEDPENLFRLDRLEQGMAHALLLTLGIDASKRSVPRFCLRELPAEIGKLKALQQLHLRHTSSLSALPNSIGSLENLEILDISHSGIEELPNGIGSLRKLRELRALGCRKLKGILVESMANLSSLRYLEFRDCLDLQSLPDLPSGLTYLGVTCRSHQLPSLSHLPHLKELRVERCGFIQCIQELPSTQLKSSECSQPTDIEEMESPQSLNTPFKFEYLQVSFCRSIEMLDVSQFVHLRTLCVGPCKNLLEIRGLDKLIYLESLTIESCLSIEQLDLPKLEGLKKLTIHDCRKLAKIQGLDRLEYLEWLDIDESMERRLDLPKSGRLKKLEAINCKNLAKIQGLDSLVHLESLNIYLCTSIGWLDLPKSRMLKRLEAPCCENLAKIQGLDSLEYLESLNISQCTSIERLDLPNPGMLKKLKAWCCKNLAEIQGLDSLESLESLDISRCTSIERLDLPKSGRLKELQAGGCINLAEIQGLDESNYLESLDISRCTSIGWLDLPKSGMLKRLEAWCCENLAGLDSLEYLESLDISRCNSIERLLLPKSKSLKILRARECENLVEIQGLDRLEFLEELNIIGCKSLKTIPKLFRTRIYRHYQITDGRLSEPNPYYMYDSDEGSG